MSEPSKNDVVANPWEVEGASNTAEIKPTNRILLNRRKYLLTTKKRLINDKDEEIVYIRELIKRKNNAKGLEKDLARETILKNKHSLAGLEEVLLGINNELRNIDVEIWNPDVELLDLPEEPVNKLTAKYLQVQEEYRIVHSLSKNNPGSNLNAIDLVSIAQDSLEVKREEDKDRKREEAKEKRAGLESEANSGGTVWRRAKGLFKGVFGVA